LVDDLEIHAARQIDGALVPAREALLLAQIFRVVDVLVQVDVFFEVVLKGVHVFVGGEHELAPHESVAERHELLEELHRDLHGKLAGRPICYRLKAMRLRPFAVLVHRGPVALLPPLAMRCEKGSVALTSFHPKTLSSVKRNPHASISYT